MTLLFTRKLSIILVSVVALIGLAFGGFYYLKLKPLQVSVEQARTSLATEEALLATFNEKIQSNEAVVYEDSTELQRRVPVKPIVEQFLLDLEKAEVVSESFISSMSFTHEDVTVENQEGAGGPTLEEQVKDAGQISEAEAVQSGETKNEQEQEVTVAPPAPASLPPGMKRLTVSLSVESPDYYAMEAFLKAIEDFERITKVDTLTFTGPPEQTSVEESEDLTYSLTISTFYHPGLNDLYDEVPPFDTPEPANKKNPLTIAGMIREVEEAANNSNDQNSETKQVEESETITQKRSTANSSLHGRNNVDKQLERVEAPSSQEGNQVVSKSKPTTVKHIVKDGETLFTLSMRYFKSPRGIELIQKQNGIVGNEIYTGQTLQIPIDY